MSEILNEGMKMQKLHAHGIGNQTFHKEKGGIIATHKQRVETTNEIVVCILQLHIQLLYIKSYYIIIGKICYLCCINNYNLNINNNNNICAHLYFFLNQKTQFVYANFLYYT